MTEYKNMVLTYRESIERLGARIKELNERIRKRNTDSGETIGLLMDRRYKLYQEIWEMQASIRMVQEYIDAVEERGRQNLLITA